MRRSQRVTPSALLATGLLLPALAAASPGSPDRTIRPTDRAWERFGLAERVPVAGDLVDPDCPSVTLLRLRPGTRLPPHAAQVDRTYLLLSGTLHVGFGKKWDAARMRTLPAGSFWVVPASTSTFEWSEDEAVCEVVATRPARDCPRPDEAVVHTPDQIVWRPSGRTERAVLAGDPSRTGCPFVERSRLPADAAAVAPPAAPGDPVLWTVLSGTLLRTKGSVAPAGAPAELPAGTVVMTTSTLDLAGSDPTGAVVQWQFPGTGPPFCKWRESHR